MTQPVAVEPQCIEGLKPLTVISERKVRELLRAANLRSSNNVRQMQVETHLVEALCHNYLEKLEYL